MKKVILFSLLLIISVATFSQKTFFSIGPELAFPGSSKSLSDNAGTGIGGSLRVESVFGKRISGTATVGYLGFSEQELTLSGTPPTKTKVSAILIQIGTKYYPKEALTGFFVSAELGLMPTTTRFDFATNPDRTHKENGLSCAPGIGYQMGNIEAGLRLQYNLSASGFNVYYYGFRLAYSFKKKNGKK